MNREEAIKILTRYNKWRRSKDGNPEEVVDAQTLGEAIDYAINAITEMRIPKSVMEGAIRAHIAIEESGEPITFLEIFKRGAEWYRDFCKLNKYTPKTEYE